jgi:hypothetical protein
MDLSKGLASPGTHLRVYPPDPSNLTITTSKRAVQQENKTAEFSLDTVPRGGLQSDGTGIGGKGFERSHIIELSEEVQ